MKSQRCIARIILSLVLWLAFAGSGLGQDAISVATLPARTVLSGTAETLDLTGFFQAQNVAGTVVQMTLMMSGTNLVTGTSMLNLALSDSATPVTVANFLSYVNSGAYQNSLIHRSNKQTGLGIIQGGGYFITDGTSNLTGNTLGEVYPAYAPIINEYSDSRPNVPGTIAMARTSDPDSATSQWFINVTDNSEALNSNNTGGYAVFGRVLGSGTALMDQVFALPVSNLANRLSSYYDTALTEIPLSKRFSGTAKVAKVPRPECVVVESATVVQPMVFTVTSNNPEVATPVLSGTPNRILSLAYGDSGTATITVTATGLEGPPVQQSFAVNVEPQTTPLVAFASGSLAVSGTSGSVNLTVVRTGGAGAFQVQCATSASDYVITSGTTLVFDELDTSKTISISLPDEPVLPPGKSFTVQLSNPNPVGGAVLGTQSSATVTIVDVADTIQFAMPSYRVNPSDGSAAVTVTRTGTEAGVSVAFATSDDVPLTAQSAKASRDYVATSGTLSFLAGETSLDIPIAVKTVSANRSFNLTLSNPTGFALVGAQNQARITILKNTSNPVFEFSGSNYLFTDGTALNDLGSAGTVTITRSSAGISTTAYVELIDGSAVCGQDYAAYDSGSNALGGPVVAVPFSQYDTSENILLVGAVNGTKNLTLKLVSTSYGGVIGKPNTAAVTFLDSQNPNGILSFSPTTYVADESSRTASLTVTRTGTVGAVQFQCTTVPGTAKRNVDYKDITGIPFSFADGASTATVTVPLVNDRAANPSSRSFKVLLSNAAGGGTISSGSTATVTIIEANNPKGIFEFENPSYSFNENAGWAELTVLRNGGTASSTDVLLGTIDTTGTSVGRGVIYGWPSISSYFGLTVCFAPGQSRQKVLIPLVNGAVSSGTQSGVAGAPFQFSAFLASPSVGILGASSSTSVTIMGSGNLTMPSVEFAATDYRVNDNAGTVTLEARLYASATGAPVNPISVPFEIQSDSAMLGTDYSTVAGATNVVLSNTTSTSSGTTISGTLIFDGVASVDLPLTVIARPIPRNGPVPPAERRFSVQLSSPSEGAALLAQTTAQVTIIGQSAKAGVFEIERPSYDFYQDCGSFEVNVIRSGSASQIAKAASVLVTTNDGSAEGNRYDATDSSGDIIFSGFKNYASASETLNFAAGQTSKTIQVLALDRTIAGASGNLLVRIESADSDAQIGANDAGVVTLWNPEGISPTTLDFDQPSYSIDGTAGVFNATVRRIVNSGNGGDTVSVGYFILEGTAIQGLDYTVSSTTGTLTFQSGSVIEPLPVTILNRSAAVDRQFWLQLDNPVNTSSPDRPVILGANNLVPVTIQSATLPYGQFQFDAPAYSVDESPDDNDLDSVAIRVVRTGSTDKAASVKVQTADGTESGGGVAGYDYLGTNATLNFAAGEWEKEVMVLIGVSAPRYFSVGLASTGKGAIGTQNSALVSIVPSCGNATPPAIGFDHASYYVDNTDGLVYAPVRLYASGTDSISVHYFTTDATAAAGVNYTGTSGTVTLAGATSGTSLVTGTVAVHITPNQETMSPDRFFLLQLDQPSTSGTLPVTLLGNCKVPVIIDGFDNPNGVVEFGTDAYSPSPGQTATIALTRKGGASGSVTVLLAVMSGGTAVSGTDYTPFPYTYSAPYTYMPVTFPSGQRSPSAVASIKIQIKSKATAGRTIPLEVFPYTGGATVDPAHNKALITISSGG